MLLGLHFFNSHYFVTLPSLLIISEMWFVMMEGKAPLLLSKRCFHKKQLALGCVFFNIAGIISHELVFLPWLRLQLWRFILQLDLQGLQRLPRDYGGWRCVPMKLLIWTPVVRNYKHFFNGLLVVSCVMPYSESSWLRVSGETVGCIRRAGSAAFAILQKLHSGKGAHKCNTKDFDNAERDNTHSHGEKHAHARP